MIFTKHFNLEGLHAPFSASQPSWLRYDDAKALDVYHNKKSAEMGTRLHAWAAETIKLGIKQPRSNKTLYRYVNDAIGYQMEPEVVLFYSNMFFGTADTISFRNNLLRIHDLKTGVKGNIDSHFDQLMIYAALFCLEYRMKPSDIDIELRVYKNDEMKEFVPDPSEIQAIMDHIVHLNKLLEQENRK